VFSVLVTKRVYKEAIDFLHQHADVDYVSTDEGLSPSELILRARGKQAIVSHLTDGFSADVLSQLEGVRVVASVGVGFDNIDIAAATERGILVTNTTGVNTDTTADFAFTLLLAAARRITEADTYVHSGKWTRGAIDMLAGLDVHSRTLGILGMGGSARPSRGVARDSTCEFFIIMRGQSIFQLNSRAKSGYLASLTSSACTFLSPPRPDTTSPSQSCER